MHGLRKSACDTEHVYDMKQTLYDSGALRTGKGKKSPIM